MPAKQEGQLPEALAFWIGIVYAVPAPDEITRPHRRATQMATLAGE